MSTISIPLPGGKYALIDAADYDRTTGYCWQVWRRAHALYAIGYPWGQHRDTRNRVLLHRLILQDGLKPDQIIDHRDGNGLNCQRSNLRIATPGQNNQNRRLNKNSTSGYKGVYWVNRIQQWRVDIRHNHKKYFVGHFKSAEDAAHAYDEKARELFGEFACLNFPCEGEIGARR